MPTGFQVRVDHQTMLHPDWVKQNEDGTAELTIPADTHELALHLAYNNSMEIYVQLRRGQKRFRRCLVSRAGDLSKGFVAANGCVKPKENEKFKTTAVPGELILFVREKNLMERNKAERCTERQALGETPIHF